MKKRIFLFIVVFTFLFAINTQTVRADDPAPQCKTSQCVYVDSTLDDDNENGSPDHPYNEIKEGKALAQSQPRGAYLYVKGADGKWIEEFIPRATPGAQGTPLPDTVIYIILAVLALGLMLAGLWFMKRSRQFQN